MSETGPVLRTTKTTPELTYPVTEASFLICEVQGTPTTMFYSSCLRGGTEFSDNKQGLGAEAYWQLGVALNTFPWGYPAYAVFTEA